MIGTIWMSLDLQDQMPLQVDIIFIWLIQTSDDWKQHKDYKVWYEKGILRHKEGMLKRKKNDKGTPYNYYFPCYCLLG